MQSIIKTKSVKLFLILSALLTVGAACRSGALLAQQNAVKTETENNQETPAAKRQSKIVSGEYALGLMLAVSANGELTGYYNSSTGAGNFSCIFYLRGKLQNDAAEITTWFPADKGTIRGKLKFVEQDGKPNVNIKLAEEPGGCWNVNPEFDDANGSTLFLEQSREWRAIRVVAANKARFYDASQRLAKPPAYVVKGDAVGVFKTENGWAEVEFINHCADAECSKTRITRGWLKEADLFSSEPPK